MGLTDERCQRSLRQAKCNVGRTSQGKQPSLCGEGNAGDEDEPKPPLPVC